ncbi:MULTISPECIES: 1-phosphofructokinase [Fictibacillus]|uniref:Tagatose-6-phosphate kinase n=1 Tax=Fictibacillus enclensis TaxID=1017270 RepID=A0A0V8JDR0_9BACL|nr:MULTISPECIES: 1-phosphofructokinase [Fictibacillus]KSU85279.1 1-phosphofructokinase [Fictibacillus enclensis]RXY99055.1 1-phosphofructokinase [Fictibacillus sp. S7]SCB94279.1 1-phosphofructokinase [Fictibacillus enclensis]
MIYTVTLNPSIDYFVKTDGLKEGEINLVNEQSIVAGGKGINVSKVLKNLGVDSVATGFVGGFTGDFVESSLQKADIGTRFIRVEENTRINIKLNTGKETEINGISPSIPVSALEQLEDNLLANLESTDFVVLAGSLPSSLRNEFYGQLISSIRQKGAQAILDSKGKPLQEALAHHPFLIKPNHHELGDLVGASIKDPREAAAYGRRLVNEGAQHVLVSMAGDGAVFVSKELAAFANVPSGTLENSVGAGDSVVAGFLAHFTKNGNVLEAFKYGVTAGSASAFSKGFCTAKDIDRYLPEVTVNLIEGEEG